MRIKYDATSARFCVLLNSCRNVNGAAGEGGNKSVKNILQIKKLSQE